MTRFWPTAGVACFLVLVCVGLWSAVRGEMIEVQGQWLGSLPLDGGDDCRIRIFPTGAFDFECRGRTSYAAKGQWRRYGNKLEMSFSFFFRDSKPVSPLPETWVFRTDGARNALFVGLPSERGEPHRWKRAPL